MRIAAERRTSLTARAAKCDVSRLKLRAMRDDASPIPERRGFVSPGVGLHAVVIGGPTKPEGVQLAPFGYSFRKQAGLRRR